MFACDDFKESITGARAGELLTAAAHRVLGQCVCRTLPVADGGEGTAAALVNALQGEWVSVPVHDPLMELVQACYGRVNGNHAIVEMAAASGLALVPNARRDPLVTTSYGTGELIRHALHQGCRQITVAIGGSATNDGGMGCARALGVRFYDADGRPLAGCGQDLARVARIDLSGRDPLLNEAAVTVLCDVTNPLCGERGATRVFGPQKGASEKAIVLLEQGMCRYRDLLRTQLQVDCDAIPGAGAAGGMGAALVVFAGGRLRQGAETVLDMLRFDQLLAQTDLVVTGEGRTDAQSLMGKVVGTVVRRAAARGVPAAVLSGLLGPGARRLLACGAGYLAAASPADMPLAEALARAEETYATAAHALFDSAFVQNLLMAKKV